MWKVLDVVSTYIAFNYSPLHLAEVNVLINLLAPVIGFTAAIVVTSLRCSFYHRELILSKSLL